MGQWGNGTIGISNCCHALQAGQMDKRTKPDFESTMPAVGGQGDKGTKWFSFSPSINPSFHHLAYLIVPSNLLYILLLFYIL